MEAIKSVLKPGGTSENKVLYRTDGEKHLPSPTNPEQSTDSTASPYASPDNGGHTHGSGTDPAHAGGPTGQNTTTGLGSLSEKPSEIAHGDATPYVNPTSSSKDDALPRGHDNTFNTEKKHIERDAGVGPTIEPQQPYSSSRDQVTHVDSSHSQGEVHPRTDHQHIESSQPVVHSHHDKDSKADRILGPSDRTGEHYGHHTETTMHDQTTAPLREERSMDDNTAAANILHHGSASHQHQHAAPVVARTSSRDSSRSGHEPMRSVTSDNHTHSAVGAPVVHHDSPEYDNKNVIVGPTTGEVPHERGSRMKEEIDSDSDAGGSSGAVGKSDHEKQKKERKSGGLFGFFSRDKKSKEDTEHERLEKERAHREKEQIKERERLDKEQAKEHERLAKERAKEHERLAKEQAKEHERLEKERLERARLDREHAHRVTEQAERDSQDRSLAGQTTTTVLPVPAQTSHNEEHPHNEAEDRHNAPLAAGTTATGITGAVAGFLHRGKDRHSETQAPQGGVLSRSSSKSSTEERSHTRTETSAPLQARAADAPQQHISDHQPVATSSGSHDKIAHSASPPMALAGAPSGQRRDNEPGNPIKALAGEKASSGGLLHRSSSGSKGDHPATTSRDLAGGNSIGGALPHHSPSSGPHSSATTDHHLPQQSSSSGPHSSATAASNLPHHGSPSVTHSSSTADKHLPGAFPSDQAEHGEKRDFSLAPTSTDIKTESREKSAVQPFSEPTMTTDTSRDNSVAQSSTGPTTTTGVLRDNSVAVPSNEPVHPAHTSRERETVPSAISRSSSASSKEKKTAIHETGHAPVVGSSIGSTGLAGSRATSAKIEAHPHTATAVDPQRSTHTDHTVPETAALGGGHQPASHLTSATTSSPPAAIPVHSATQPSRDVDMLRDSRQPEPKHDDHNTAAKLGLGTTAIGGTAAGVAATRDRDSSEARREHSSDRKEREISSDRAKETDTSKKRSSMFGLLRRDKSKDGSGEDDKERQKEESNKAALEREKEKDEELKRKEEKAQAAIAAENKRVEAKNKEVEKERKKELKKQEKEEKKRQKAEKKKQKEAEKKAKKAGAAAASSASSSSSSALSRSSSDVDHGTATAAGIGAGAGGAAAVTAGTHHDKPIQQTVVHQPHDRDLSTPAAVTTDTHATTTGTHPVTASTHQAVAGGEHPVSAVSPDEYTKHQGQLETHKPFGENRSPLSSLQETSRITPVPVVSQASTTEQAQDTSRHVQAPIVGHGTTSQQMEHEDVSSDRGRAAAVAAPVAITEPVGSSSQRGDDSSRDHSRDSKSKSKEEKKKHRFSSLFGRKDKDKDHSKSRSRSRDVKEKKREEHVGVLKKDDHREHREHKERSVSPTPLTTSKSAEHEHDTAHTHHDATDSDHGPVDENDEHHKSSLLARKDTRKKLHKDPPPKVAEALAAEAQAGAAGSTPAQTEY